jgi:8-oxo-dGTP diphosphatase
MTDIPNAASVALIAGDRVLVIQRARDPWAGLWSLPGGRVEPGEDAEACAVRELGEEIGVVPSDLVEVVQLRAGSGGRFLLQVFATRAFSGTPVANDEVSDFRWLTLAEIAALPTTPNLAEVLAEAFRRVDRG